MRFLVDAENPAAVHGPWRQLNWYPLSTSIPATAAVEEVAITTTTAGIATTTLDLTAESRVDAAAQHLYDQEVALHYARQTGVND